MVLCDMIWVFSLQSYTIIVWVKHRNVQQCEHIGQTLVLVAKTDQYCCNKTGQQQLILVDNIETIHKQLQPGLGSQDQQTKHCFGAHKPTSGSIGLSFGFIM